MLTKITVSVTAPARTTEQEQETMQHLLDELKLDQGVTEHLQAFLNSKPGLEKVRVRASCGG